MTLDQKDIKILKSFLKDKLLILFSIAIIACTFFLLIILYFIDKSNQLVFSLLFWGIYLSLFTLGLSRAILDIKSNKKIVKKGKVTDMMEYQKHYYNLEGGPDARLSEYYLKINNKRQIDVEKEIFEQLEIGDKINMYYSSVSKKFIRAELRIT